jgi:hypothetical protein
MTLSAVRIFVASAFVFLSACVCSMAQGRSVEILVTFDYPGASLTIAHGINQHGDVAGEFDDINGSHAFIRYRNGAFSQPITDPNDNEGETFGTDLNRSALAGYYFDLTNFVFHSFLYAQGAFTSLDIAGAPSTAVLGLNSAGDYSGQVDDASGATQGFVNIAGQLFEFAIAGASFTAANAINDLGSAVGVYELGDANNHGYLRDVSGRFTFPIDYPGATSTILRGINSRGWIVGSYIDAQLVQHGFLFRPPNSYLSYTYRDSILTSIEGINDQGQICGQYKDTFGQRHAFIGRIR